MSSQTYQALTGLSEINTDEINADTLTVNTLVLPNGAVDGYVLTSDPGGIASWQPNAGTLLGDVTGPLTSNTVALVGGSTASEVNDAVQNRKYRGDWSSPTNYNVGNEVTISDRLYIATTNNVSVNPTIDVPTTTSMFTTAIPFTLSANTGSYELGVRFTLAYSGTISALRFYKHSSMGLTSRVLKIWSTAGTLLASVTTTGEPTSGWITGTLAAPYTVTAGSTYIVSYNHPSGQFSPLDFSTANQSTGITLSGGGSTAGCYSSTNGAFPNNFNNLCFFIDITYNYGSTGGDWKLLARGMTLVERAMLTNATSSNTASTLALRSAAGVISADIIGNLTGNASTATSFTGSLIGDVTGTQGATYVSTIQGQPVSNYATLTGAQMLTNKTMTDATNTLAANFLRAAGTQWAGGAIAIVNNSTLTPGQVLTYLEPSGSTGQFQFENVPTGTMPDLTGECTSVGSVTTLTNSAVINKILTGYASGSGIVSAADSLLSFANKTGGNIASLVSLLGAPTPDNTSNQIVKRDVSGSFSAGTITANLTGIASDVANSAVIAKLLTGYVAGAGTISSADSILSAFQKTTGNMNTVSSNLATVTTKVNNGTALATANTLMLRDGNADVAVRDITVRRIIDSTALIPILDTLSGSQPTNTFVGRNAGNQTTSSGGSANTLVGKFCGTLIGAGAYNCGMGYGAFNVLSTGTNNTAIGVSALSSITTQSDTTGIGAQAGYNNTGGQCTFLGSNADSSASASWVNSTAIGYGAKITASNQVRIGNSSVTSVIASGPFTCPTLATTSSAFIGTNLQVNGSTTLQILGVVGTAGCNALDVTTNATVGGNLTVGGLISGSLASNATYYSVGFTEIIAQSISNVYLIMTFSSGIVSRNVTSPTTSSFTVSGSLAAAGAYKMSFNIFAVRDAYVFVAVFVNGVQSSRDFQGALINSLAGDRNSHVVNGQHIVELNAGDVVTLRVKTEFEPSAMIYWGATNNLTSYSPGSYYIVERMT